MLNKDQKQEVAEGATAIQAAGDVIIGITADEARNIALDVARSNLLELSGIARDIANARVEEITDKVIAKLAKEYPEGLDEAKSPDFQHALFTVQKQYARTGDEDQGNLLVDLLIDRSKHTQRNMLQITLNESLNVIPLLTENQINILSLVFLLKYSAANGIKGSEALGAYFDNHVFPFAKISTHHTNFQHLEFARCGSVQIGEISLAKILLSQYSALFSNGFNISEINNRSISIGPDPRFFIKCLNNNNNVQVSALNTEVLENLFKNHKITEPDRQKIRDLFNLNMMSEEDVRKKCVEIRSYMSTIFDKWSNSDLKSFTLTTVGITIGHANLKKNLGDFSDLSIWIK